MTDVRDLEAVPLFGGLTGPQLEKVVRVLRPARVPAGKGIIAEGERGRSLFVLVRGTVETTKALGAVGPDGAGPRQKVLVRLSAPQFFGEVGLLEDAERSATVRAATECDLLELRREDFERLVAADVQLGYVVVRNIAAALIGRLRDTDRDVLKLTAALSLALGNR